MVNFKTNINIFLGKIEKKISRNRFRLLHTLYFNFRLLPFKQAIHLPVYIYGKIQFAYLGGRIIITQKISSGMVKIGRHIDNYENCGTSVIYIDEKSTIIFEGLASFGQSLVLRVVEGGNLRLGNKIWVGEKVGFDCTYSITLQEGASITHGCFITDSNHHYIIDADNKIHRYKGSIIIGKYNWIGNSTIITKGTITSDYSIVSQGSLLNKDYVSMYNTTDSMLLAGMPAKLHKKGCKRIFGARNEKTITTFFNSHPMEDVFVWKDPLIDSMDDRFFK